VSTVAEQARNCTICGRHVRFPVAGTDVVCESADCRLLLSRRADLGPDAFRFLVAVRGQQRRDLQRFFEVERERRAERTARHAMEHEAIRQSVGLEHELPASRYPLLVLPNGPPTLAPLPEERRQRYRRHLDSIIGEAVEAGDTGTAPEPAADEGPVPLGAHLCTVCRGGCCPSGGERAYLTAETIRRVMRLRPELRPEQIADEYLARLADRTVDGSCVNHTVTGCGLPRQMRSDTCNDYYCDPVRDWQARCASGERPLGAFVIQRRQSYWNRDRLNMPNDVVGVSVVTEAGIRTLETPFTPPTPQDPEPSGQP
jgi:hypothetical protein